MSIRYAHIWLIAEIENVLKAISIFRLYDFLGFDKKNVKTQACSFSLGNKNRLNITELKVALEFLELF